MNRIILIGNGFDLAHGLKTSYADFIDDLWEHDRVGLINNLDADIFTYEGKYITVQAPRNTNVTFKAKSIQAKGFSFFIELGDTQFSDLNNNRIEIILRYRNKFLFDISLKQTLKNWVDVEEAYYTELIELLRDDEPHLSDRKVIKEFSENEKKVKMLNKEFSELQMALENYLEKQMANNVFSTEINDIFYSSVSQDDFIEKSDESKIAENTLFLNFNYTPTLVCYVNNQLSSIIHIHGKIKAPDNPIVFGYGDEIDERYIMLENKNNNEYLANIKSFKYSRTNNYRDMLRFIFSGKYQVFIMGHSCGLSDRTLLNVLFEHENCKSIKIFYYIDKNGNDNYSETYMNLSRSFKNKSKMREIVVAKESSVPYVDLQECV